MRQKSAAFKALYRLRYAVERIFKSLKESRRLERHCVRGLQRVALHAAMSTLAFQATALTQIQAGEEDRALDGPGGWRELEGGRMFRSRKRELSWEEIKTMLKEARERSERAFPRFDDHLVREIALRRMDARNDWALNDPAVLKRQLIEAFRFARAVAATDPAPRRPQSWQR